ncbi:MAG TPA: phosphoribosylpyrophosphate synthetase [Chitinophagales bacterium]|nr:phosphoribosylpyrophosphate synthetase [Chitinophagales bacterium]
MVLNDEKVNMKTMSSCINSLVEKGFTENFMVNENGLTAVSTQQAYSPAQVKVINFYRFEGESDPGDSAILYAIETSDGIKGTLTDAFGTYADDDVQKFMCNVEEIAKKTGNAHQ